MSSFIELPEAGDPQGQLRRALREWRRSVLARIEPGLLSSSEPPASSGSYNIIGLMRASGIDEQRQLLPLPTWIDAEPPPPPAALVRPLAHAWESRTLAAGLTVECCVHGDAVRRRDGRELPCRGPARIDLRSRP